MNNQITRENVAQYCKEQFSLDVNYNYLYIIDKDASLSRKFKTDEVMNYIVVFSPSQLIFIGCTVRGTFTGINHVINLHQVSGVSVKQQLFTAHHELSLVIDGNKEVFNFSKNVDLAPWQQENYNFLSQQGYLSKGSGGW